MCINLTKYYCALGKHTTPLFQKAKTLTSFCGIIEWNYWGLFSNIQCLQPYSYLHCKCHIFETHTLQLKQAGLCFIWHGRVNTSMQNNVLKIVREVGSCKRSVKRAVRIYVCNDFTGALRWVMWLRTVLLRKYDNKVHCAFVLVFCPQFCFIFW